jgi:hypothetical protein
MRRREFIAGVGSAVVWPVVARAQQLRRIGVLMNGTADDALSATNRSAFLQGLQQFGWTEGRNLRIDYRFGAADPENDRKYAAELLALTPDVILAAGASTLASLLRATRSVPIVFVQVSDPVGGGSSAGKKSQKLKMDLGGSHTGGDDEDRSCDVVCLYYGRSSASTDCSCAPTSAARYGVGYHQRGNSCHSGENSIGGGKRSADTGDEHQRRV